MENLITRPIEKQLKSLNNVKDIKSTSVQDFSSIVVEFTPGVELAKAIQDVKDAVDKSKSELPTDLDQDPNVLEVNTSDFPIMNVNISGPYSEQELKRFGEYLEDAIEKLPEISKADLAGTVEREIQINVDPYKMESVGVNFGDISGAVQTENLTISGGSIKNGDFERTLRIDGEFTNPEDLLDIIVKTDQQKIVYLRDVAEIKDRFIITPFFPEAEGFHSKPAHDGIEIHMPDCGIELYREDAIADRHTICRREFFPIQQSIDFIDPIPTGIRTRNENG
jgi:multidrug efflux pump subunit AcrB